MHKHTFWRLAILFLIIFWGGVIYLLSSCTEEPTYEFGDTTKAEIVYEFGNATEFKFEKDLEWLGDTLIVNAKAFKKIIIKVD